MFRLSAILFICAVNCDANCKSWPFCPKNSSMNICGTICEPSCTNPNPTICPAIACSEATRGCRCNKGYVRDEKTKKCVPLSKCSKCAHGETLLSCGRICEGTCASPFVPEACKHTACLIASCGCDLAKGYVRCPKKDKCVRVWNCHRRHINQ
ncbi:hypothetical protein PV325_013647 [Microctonus aethiopoides]|uniref:TIL domain-containing protein n=1 Tax=Microctonus aethiopoides TaxID=144406 RepID=A0AA39KLU2_9HYME|nr:hypothetical protein PV325_013647 [Microctonus aethiopoides]KAK0093505.1 hypothetical protein PV326_013381 [Microctonus aethiopoides]KAK0166092.1 hypothetical protein PV328_004540 [Microctonus aethiopoides]